MSGYPPIFGAQGSCKESDSASSPTWTPEFGWFITQYCHFKKHLKKHQAKNGVYVCIYIYMKIHHLYPFMFVFMGRRMFWKSWNTFRVKYSKIAKQAWGSKSSNFNARKLGVVPQFPHKPTIPSHHSACGEAGASAVSCIIEKPHCGWESMGFS